MKYYECGVRQSKVQPDGTVKTVTDLYVVEAVSFTEAEARVTQLVTPFTHGDHDVVAIRRTKYEAVIPHLSADADKWFKVKANILRVNPKTGYPKKDAVYYLVNAGSFDDAKACGILYLSGTKDDWELATIDETKIVEVYVSNRS